MMSVSCASPSGWTGRCYASARAGVQGEQPPPRRSTPRIRRRSVFDPDEEAEGLQEAVEAVGGDSPGGADANRLALVLIPELQVDAHVHRRPPRPSGGRRRRRDGRRGGGDGGGS